MDIKKTVKLTALLAGVIMAASLAMTACDGGETCKEHVDADGDGVCDVCHATVSTESNSSSESASETESGTAEAKKVAVAMTVRAQDGAPVPGAVMRIALLDEWYDEDTSWDPISVTTDENGAVSVDLTEGTYRLTYETLPENFLAGTVVLTVEDGMEPVALEVTDNTPDGSEDRPFFLGEGSMTVAFPENTAYHFTLFAGDRRSLVLENLPTDANNTVEVTVNGVTYTPDENGLLIVKIEGEDVEEQVRLTVTNQGGARDLTLTTRSELGSMNNPIVIETLTETAEDITVTVPAGMIMYYAWTADKDGTLKVTSADTANNISLHNKTTGQSTSFSDGTAEVSLDVKAGDVVLLHVAVKLTTEDDAQLTFAVALDAAA